jgi:phage terminase large subunit-like protein
LLYLKPNLSYANFIEIFIDLILIIINKDITIDELKDIFKQIFDIIIINKKNSDGTTTEIWNIQNNKIFLDKFKEEFGINNLIEIYKIII